MAQKVFKWAAVAKRPLQVEELKEAVAFESDDKSWNMDKIPHEDLMFESCRGLIIKNEDDETAHFAHHTVRQYLIGGLTTTHVDPQFEIRTVDAEILAGLTCVAYLSFSDFETQITSTTSTVRLEKQGVLDSGGPLWIPSILGIRKPVFDIPYRLLRGDPALRPSESDYLKYFVPKAKPKFNPSTQFIDKYRLLSYAIENWEPHTRFYNSSEPRLERLALHKILAFEFRPWGPNQHFGPYGCVGCPNPSAVGLVTEDLPHMSMVHYAAEVGNLVLLVSGLTDDSTAWVSDITSKLGYLYHERYHQETLMIACRHNRLRIVKYLVTSGYYVISDGRAVNAAAAAGHAEVLQYLLTLDQYPVKQQGHMALLLAAQHGHDAIITMLADAGVDLDAKDQRTGSSAIEAAAMNGHESAIRALLQEGASLRLDDGVDNGPFLLAAKGGHVKVLELLTEFFRSVNYRLTSSGQTALHLAAAGGHVDAIRWLVGHGAEVNKTDFRHERPLHLAVKLGDKSAVRVLLEIGAKVGQSFPNHNSVLEIAVENGTTGILEMLLENISEDQFTAKWDRRENIVDALESARKLKRRDAQESLERELALYQ